MPAHPIVTPPPWPAPPAASPNQITLNSYDLMWLAMGGTINDAVTNSQIRLEMTTCRPGAFQRALEAGQLPAAFVALLAKGLNKTIVNGASGYPVEGSDPTVDQLSDEVQRAMDKESALGSNL